jgi:hypothetical protein
VSIEHNGLSLHGGSTNTGDRRRRSMGSDSSSAARLACALAHLKAALAAVDGLFSDASTGRLSERNSYQLGEASHVMHYALLALSECADPVGATGVASGVR